MDEPTREKLAGRRLLSAAAHHDIPLLKTLLKISSAKIKDDETGYSPLHAAIASWNLSGRRGEWGDELDQKAIGILTSGSGSRVSTTEPSEALVVDVVRLLFENGAIWNELDAHDETPGCIAWRLGLMGAYRVIVEAGVRAELLLTKLGELNGDDEDDEDEVDEGDDVESQEVVTDMPDQAETAGTISTDQKSLEQPPLDYIDHWDSNNAFLHSSLKYTDTTLLDSSSNAVMMDWEKQIMTRHAELLLPKPGLRSMNIGHGMGIVDTAMLALNPSEHHIVEAHPAVIRRLKETGWYDKPNVRIHQGRWQDVLPKLLEEGVQLDAVYYDTFAESYQDLKELFEEYVIGLLDEGGKFGFYHGLGADRRVCYDVYTEVVEIDLKDAGYSSEWEELKVPKIEWSGVRRPYWNVDIYRLPTCKFAGE